MPLTPLEIHNKEFSTRMRGYDQDEVNEFLDQVIRDYELILRQNKEKEDELEIANKKLSNYEEMQESLNRSIIVAQDAADRLKENTEHEVESMKREAESYAEKIREEADLYLEETEEKADEYSDKIREETDDHADELLKEAVMKARKIEDETETLRKQSRVFRQRLQLLIESQLDLLTKEDWDNLLVGQPIEYPNIETIAEVEKELEEKTEDSLEENTEEQSENEESADDRNLSEEDSTEIESTEEIVEIEEEEHYNSSDSESEEYEEGTMPAVELADSEE
ncbi:MAG: DivIVA domain-containing protein [Atopostipes sp.]|nr:DivIVA domain-containing protein [Atopostipes sp.]